LVNSKDKERKIEFELGKQFAMENGLIFLECSAKLGENILEIFEFICTND
jgi:hypothetical protein